MTDLKLQSKTWESRNRVWQNRAPTPVEEKPRKQVRFNLDDELCSEPTLPKMSRSFWLKERPSSDLMLLSLLQQDMVIHNSQPLEKAPNEVPSPPEEPGLKSSPPLANPS